MPTFDAVTVAAVRAAPVILDSEASIATAMRLLGNPARDGAQLTVFPETFFDRPCG